MAVLDSSLLLPPHCDSLVFRAGLAGKAVPAQSLFILNREPLDALHVDSAKTINALGGITLICAVEPNCCQRSPSGKDIAYIKDQNGGETALTCSNTAKADCLGPGNS